MSGNYQAVGARTHSQPAAFSFGSGRASYRDSVQLTPELLHVTERFIASITAYVFQSKVQKEDECGAFAMVRAKYWSWQASIGKEGRVALRRTVRARRGQFAQVRVDA